MRRVAFALFLSFLAVCAYPITVNVWWQDLTAVAGLELFVQSALMPFSFSLTHVFLFRLLHGSLLEQGRRVTAASKGRSAAQEKKSSRLVEMPDETPGTSASNRQPQSSGGGMANGKSNNVPNPLNGGDNGGGNGGNRDDQSPWRMDHGNTVLVDVPLHGTADSGELNSSTAATASSTEVSGAG